MYADIFTPKQCCLRSLFSVCGPKTLEFPSENNPVPGKNPFQIAKSNYYTWGQPESFPKQTSVLKNCSFLRGECPKCQIKVPNGGENFFNPQDLKSSGPAPFSVFFPFGLFRGQKIWPRGCEIIPA